MSVRPLHLTDAASAFLCLGKSFQQLSFLVVYAIYFSFWEGYLKIVCISQDGLYHQITENKLSVLIMILVDFVVLEHF